MLNLVRRQRRWLGLIALGALMLSLFTTLTATRAFADAPPAASAAASASAAAPPPLPGYFSGANDTTGKPPTWPDPTGGAAGVWATPAGAGRSVRPDRSQHVLHQHGLGDGNGLPGHVHAGRIRDGGDRHVPRQER